MIIKKIITVLLGGILAAVSIALFGYFVLQVRSVEFPFTFYHYALLIILFSFWSSIIFFVSLLVVGLSRVDSLLKLGGTSFLYQIIILIVEPYLDIGVFFWLVMFVIGLGLNVLLQRLQRWSTDRSPKIQTNFL